jgi:hypothetical protein
MVGENGCRIEAGKGASVSVNTETSITATASDMDRALDAGGGIVRLAPTWVPRAFCTPGRRIKLHPDDYFPFQQGRGGIDERWLSSTVRADNGPLTAEFEGISLVVGPEGRLVPFDAFVQHHGAQLIGDRLWLEYRCWPMYSKFFDNQFPLPLHVHHRDHHAAALGKKGKPEAYYFPPQMNSHLGELGVTFFGLHPETTKAQFAERIAAFDAGGDNRVTELSRGYRIHLGAGWNVPAGVLHAPASICTYEPQRASDVACLCESWSNNREVMRDLLWKDVPADRVGDVEYIVELLDWERNVDPDFWTTNMMVPVESRSSASSRDDWTELWIVYRAMEFSAKELTVQPGRTVTVRDTDAYGCVVVGGSGSMNGRTISSPSLIRYGQLTEDEFFVSASAARAGVVIINASGTEPLVILKHFGPGNEELAADRDQLQALGRR